jgi:hypothetical protein
MCPVIVDRAAPSRIDGYQAGERTTAAPLPLLGAQDAPVVRIGLPPTTLVTLADIDGGCVEHSTEHRPP